MLFFLWDMKQLWSALAYRFLHAGWLTHWVTHIFSWMFLIKWLCCDDDYDWVTYEGVPFKMKWKESMDLFIFLSDETSSTKQSPQAQHAESESQFLPQTRMQIKKKKNNWKFKWDQLKHTDTLTLTHTDTASRRRVAMTPDEGGACRNNMCGVTGNLAACGSAASVVWAGCCSARNKHTSNCPSGTGSRCGRATVSQSSAKHEIN